MPAPSPSIPESVLRRKGARDTASVPDDVRRWLDQGLIETTNLCEWLVVNQLALAERVCRDQGWDHLVPRLRDAFAELESPTTGPQRSGAIARTFCDDAETDAEFHATWIALSRHRSDVVRSWAGSLLALRIGLPLPRKLELVRDLAADSHMGVRESAWSGVRDAIAADLHLSFRLLGPWVRDPDANLRRFASEVTRPRGVWCRHIPSLKDDPQPGLALLEPLRSDPSKYVRDSVGNWLNDASKSRPEWVQQVCRRWSRESPTPETAAIVRRALRTLRKSALKAS